MWKIVSVTDLNGKIKQEFYDKLEEKHPDMQGIIMFPDFLKEDGFLSFEWKDDSGKYLRTSRIKKLELHQNKMYVTTLNSIYTLVMVNKK